MGGSTRRERLYGTRRAVCLAGDRAREAPASYPGAASVVDLAHVSSLESREDRRLAELERALASAYECMCAAYDRDRPWADRVRASLSGVLELFDEKPRLAELCVIESATAGRGAAVFRRGVFGAVAHAIDEGRCLCHGDEPPPFTADAVLEGTLGAIHGRLVQPRSGRLSELLNPLMSFIVLPYGGAAAARHELSR